MDGTVSMIITGGVLISINVAGWLIQAWRNGVKESKSQGKLEMKIDNLCQQLTGLPCQADKDYLKNQGGLLATVQGHDDRLSRLENKLNNTRQA